MKKLIFSFGYAFSGILHAVMCEQNMRIHLSVANLIIAFSWYFGISRLEWAMLFVAIFFVLFAESVNTAIERLADEETSEYSEKIKHAKDVAAGAVVFSAVSALCVGIALFLDFEKIGKTLTYIFTTPSAFLICAGLFVLDILFIIFVREKKERKDSNNEGK